MPKFDGTGPDGKGPLSGRRRGNCQDRQPNHSVHDENYAGDKDIHQKLLSEIEQLKNEVKQLKEQIKNG